MHEHVIWETRNGRSVRILCTDKPGANCIVGYFMDDDCPDIFDWDFEGRSLWEDAPESDLIIPEGTGIGASE